MEALELNLFLLALDLFGVLVMFLPSVLLYVLVMSKRDWDMCDFNLEKEEEKLKKKLSDSVILKMFVVGGGV